MVPPFWALLFLRWSGSKPCWFSAILTASDSTSGPPGRWHKPGHRVPVSNEHFSAAERLKQGLLQGPVSMNVEVLGSEGKSSVSWQSAFPADELSNFKQGGWGTFSPAKAIWIFTTTFMGHTKLPTSEKISRLEIYYSILSAACGYLWQGWNEWSRGPPMACGLDVLRPCSAMYSTC